MLIHLKTSETSKEQIEKDLHRTLPRNVHFCNSGADKVSYISKRISSRIFMYIFNNIST